MCGNMKLILSVDQDISRVTKVDECYILFNTRNEFHISKHDVLFCLLYKNIPILTHKNRAVWILPQFRVIGHM